jgi:hypothetical protein
MPSTPNTQRSVRRQPLDFRAYIFLILCLVSAFSGTCAVLAVFAPAFIRRNAQFATRACAWSSGAAFAYRVLYTLAPVIRPSALQSAPLSFSEKKTLVTQTLQSNGAAYILYASFATTLQSNDGGRGAAPALVPFVILSMYQVLTIAKKRYGDDDGRTVWSKFGFERVFATAQANMELALAVCATIEISLLTPMVLDLFVAKRRSFARVFAYLSWLRSRYHCRDNTVYRIKFTVGDTAKYHREVWTMLDEKFASRVPGMRRALAPVTKWFTTAGPTIPPTPGGTGTTARRRAE